MGSLKRTVAIAAAAAALGAAPAAAQPANDAFSEAAPLSGLPVSVTGTTVDATREEGEPDHAGVGTAGSVWYRWTAPAGGTVVASLCSASYDSVLAVYTGASVDALGEVASNDDACGDDGLGSRVRFDAVSGTTYSIAVDGAGDNGSFTLAIAPPPPPPTPQPGAYSGSGEFGERVSFVLSGDGRRIRRFTIRGVDLTCTRGSVRLVRQVVPRAIRVGAGDRFATTLRVRGRNRFLATVRVAGRLIAPRRASGTIRISVRERTVGRCRYPFGAVRWTARRRG